MKKEELFEALGDIDPNSVEKARTYKKKKTKVWTKVVAAAACLALIIGVIWGVPSLYEIVAMKFLSCGANVTKLWRQIIEKPCK